MRDMRSPDRGLHGADCGQQLHALLHARAVAQSASATEEVRAAAKAHPEEPAGS